MWTGVAYVIIMEEAKTVKLWVRAIVLKVWSPEASAPLGNLLAM